MLELVDVVYDDDRGGDALRDDVCHDDVDRVDDVVVCHDGRGDGGSGDKDQSNRSRNLPNMGLAGEFEPAIEYHLGHTAMEKPTMCLTATEDADSKQLASDSRNPDLAAAPF